MSQSSDLSLAQRLVERHLAFGLACVLAGTLAIQFSLQDHSHRVATVAVAVPLAVLLLGGWMLRSVARVPGTIEAQLRTLGDASQNGSPATDALQPLCEAGSVAAGWNNLLERIGRSDRADALATRLATAFRDANGGRWQAAFEHLPEGIAITNPSGDIEAVNPALSHVLGLDPGRDLSGERLAELLQQWAGPTDNPILQQLVHSASKVTGELRRGATTADGVLRVARVPLCDDNGAAAPAGLVWMIRDTTQQRLSEEMRNEFVFTATHELRTPLANIKAYAETLTLDADIDIEKQKGFFNIINAEATRLARFIDELLDVSQMESGAMGATRHETDLERLLQEVLENVKPQARQKQLVVESVLPPKLPKLQADKDKLAAALVNLLGNAIKYTPEGGEVRLKVEQDKQQVHVHVEDTGIGIAAEELSRIGEKFYRCHDSRIQDIPGSGLGVAFAQQVARLHGGKLSIESVLNEGSRFTLSLPAPTEQN